MKKKIKGPSVFLSAWSSMRKEIKILLGVSSVSVFLIEIVLKNFEAPTETFYRAGEMYLKICYSLTASTIFFYFNVQLSKEIKKIKTIGLISNPLTTIANDYFKFTLTLFGYRTLINRSPKTIEDYAIAIAEIDLNARAEFFSIDNGKKIKSFYTWKQELAFCLNKIQNNCKYLYAFHESLEGDLLKKLHQIQTICEFLKPNYIGDDTKSFLASELHGLDIKIRELMEIKQRKYRNSFRQHDIMEHNEKLKNNS